MLDAPYPVILLILDGWGIASPSRGNAVTLSYTPNYNNLIRSYPTTAIQASGESVGLPWGEMGNSEVGHMNLGGGKVPYQNLPFINRAISNNTFNSNQSFLAAIAHAKKNNSKLHIMGLISEGCIHSSLNHLYALLELCQQQQVKEVYIHAFLDGRDTPHNSGLDYINKLSNRLKTNGFGKIATLSGRFYAMDRDNHWDRIAKAYLAMTQGVADFKAEDPIQAVEDSYQRQVFDEEFKPTVIVQQGKPVATVCENDAIIFFNFRADRARQITKAFCLPGFDKFPNRIYLRNLLFVAMMEYEKNLPVKIAFSPDKIKVPVAKVVADAGLRQIHIAETEKYAHITFFYNGGIEDPFNGEERIIIPSPAVSSYAEKPEMSAQAVKDQVLAVINSGAYHFVAVNFANADMVGHTGNLAATKKAIETLDVCLGEIISAISNTNGTLIITADHGNAEEKINLQSGEISKEHTKNPVPLFLVGRQWLGQKNIWSTIPHNDLSHVQPVGVLSDVAPTVLHLLNLPIPPEMTGRSLI